MSKRLKADYVIVGGGSAGCVLAARLTEDADVSVLLLEAGPSDWNPLIHMPAGFAILMKMGALDWGYHTEPQVNLDRRRIFWPRGRVLGGSSSTNAMVYVRGAPADYDHWAVLGNRGWSYAELLPYFKRAETSSRGADFWRGGDGPLQVERAEVDNPLAKAWIEAGLQAGYPYAEDFSGASPEGFGPIDLTIGDRRRSSAATAYLTPARSRANLTVLTGAQAARLQLDGRRATGVVFRRRGQSQTAFARREVILCGGTINSPHLLMLSGIGPGGDLRRQGIPVAQELNGVGQNLQDHISAELRQAVSKPVSLYENLKPLNGLIAGIRYVLTRSGPVATPGLQAFAWLKSSPAEPVPDLEYQVSLALYIDHGKEIIPRHGFMAIINPCRPESRGTIALRSADPFAPPLIDPNYLAEEVDRRRLRVGLHLARDIVSQHAYDAFRDVELAPGPDLRTDEELDAFIRASADTVYHPVGSCKMGNDALSVVDAELRVHGVEGLRVVDASIMPTLPGGNTNAATIAIAEKAADLLRGRKPLAPAILSTVSPQLAAA